MAAPTITSAGYDPNQDGTGTIAPNDVFGRLMAWAAGRRYAVYNADMLQVTPKLDGTRQVNIAGGFACGWGVVDKIGDGNAGLAGDFTLTDTAPTADTWYMVALRRSAGTAQKTTVVSVNAGANPVMPTSRQIWNGGGGGQVWTDDDQPLALVLQPSGSTVPTTVIDLRLIGSGPMMLANDPLVLSYCGWDGMMVRIGTDTWHRAIDPSGARVWAKLPSPYGKSPIQPVFSFSSGVGGWSALNATGTDGSRGWLDGNTAMIMLRMRNISANISFNAVGNPVGGDVTIGNLGRPEFWPDFQLDGFGAQIATPSGGAVACTVGLGVKGDIILQSGPPSQSVRKSATDFALTGTMTYIIGRVS